MWFQCFRMFGFYVKVQRLLLEELLVAVRAFMWVCAGMFLHVVVHRVLPFLHDTTMYARIVSIGVFFIGQFLHLATSGYICVSRPTLQFFLTGKV